jgi:hypothetical protein
MNRAREGVRTRTLEAYQQGPDAVVELVLSLVTEFGTTFVVLARWSSPSDVGTGEVTGPSPAS